MLLGFGFILALLLSMPVIAIATGALNDAPQYTLMRGYRHAVTAHIYRSTTARKRA